MIPVQNGVEAKCECALRLPAPEGANCKHHDVTLTERLIHQHGTAGECSASCEFAGEQHIFRLSREGKHDARGFFCGCCGCCSTATTAARCRAGCPARASTASAANRIARRSAVGLQA